MDVIMPQLGETVTEGVVTKWHKKVGDSVKTDETLFDVETDKVSTEIPAPIAGVISAILIDEGVTAKVGARLAVIDEQGVAAVAPAGAGVPRAAPAATGARLSPVVRRLIAEHGLHPSEILGNGRDGRITRDDVLDFVNSRPSAAQSNAVMQSKSNDAAGRTRRPLNAVRKRTAEHMVKSWTSVPHVLQAVEADFIQVEQARQAAAAAWRERESYSLTYLPFIAHAVAAALAKFPLLNASLDGDDLVLHSNVNLGIAVDLDFDGLIVPVVKDAGAKSLPQLAREINDLAHRARAGQLKPDEVSGGTYTLSNSGAFGTLITVPIINQPQVAILSIDGVRKKPVIVETAQGDSIAIRPVGVLAQSFDHRAVDGAYSAAFLREVKSIVENSDWVNLLQ